MTTTMIEPADPVKLRPLLHAEVDRLSDEHLALAHRMLLEIELHQLTGDLDTAADSARMMGKLTQEQIAESVAAHRKAHPYRS